MDTGEFILTTPVQLKTLMAEAVNNAFKYYQPFASAPKLDSDKWMTIQELSDYLPGKPAVTTLYGKVQRLEIPHSRMSKKRLAFQKSQIDEWLKGKSCKTQVEIGIAAEKYLSTKQKRA